MRWGLRLALVGAALGAPLHAQTSDGRVCEQCSITLQAIDRIPTESNGVAIEPGAHISYSQGRYIVMPTYDDKVGVWHDEKMSSIGRRGRGPGEFRDLSVSMASVATNGEVLISHENTLTVLAPGGQSLDRQMRLTSNVRRIIKVGRQLVTTDGRHVILLTDSGTVERQLPTTLAMKRGDVLEVASSGDTAVWVGALYTYGADLIKLDGTVLKSVRKEPDWFRSNGWVEGEPLRVRPTPKVRGVRELGQGRLMVLSTVADPKWRQRARGLPLERLVLLQDELFDSILEVIDINTGDLLASVRSDRMLGFIQGSDLLWSTVELRSGETQFEVILPVLRQS